MLEIDVSRVPTESIEIKGASNITIASAIVIHYPSTSFIDSLLVSKEYRSLGYGSALVEWLVRNTSTNLTLKADAFDDSPLTNEQLVVWYQKYGFSPEGAYMIRGSTD